MNAPNPGNLENFTLPRTSPAAIRAVDSGFLGETRVRVGGVIPGSEGEENIVFFPIAPTPTPAWSERLKRILLATRAFSLTATAMPCLALWALGGTRGLDARTGFALGAILGVVLLQIAVNLFNDVEDYRKLIDLPGTPGGSGAFHRGWYTPAEIRFAARASAGLAILVGLPILLAYPVPILACGGLGTLGAFLYSHGKVGLKYHALGDLAVLLLCGPILTAGFSLATFGELVPGYLEVGGFLGLLACALLHVNNLHDIDFDRSRGAKTLAIRLGFRNSVVALGILYAAAAFILVGAVVAGTFPRTALLALAFVAPSTKLIRKVRRALGPSSPLLEGARMRVAEIHLLAGFLMTVGILISRFAR